MNSKRILSFIIMLLFCFSLCLSGCSKSDESTQDTVKQPEEKEYADSDGKQQSEGEEMIGNMYKEGLPIVKEKVTLKATVPKEALHGDWNEMDVWNIMEQKTNVHIEWEQVPSDSFEEKKNLMFASEDLPDLFLSNLSRLDEVKYGQQGYLIPLEDLIEEWAPNVKKLFTKRSEAKKLCTAPDGHIYALLTLEELVNRYNYDNMFINKKWLDSLGLEIPTTTEEFYNVLKAFKENDPNENGKQDELPFSFIYGNATLGNYSLFGSFGVLDNPDHVMIKNGKIIFAPMEEGYKEAVKYFAVLYQEGLIDPEVFTQDKKQYFAKGKAEPVIMGCGTVWFDENLFGSERAKNDYVCLPPLEGPNGDKMWNKYLGVYSTGRGAITSNNKYPEITMRWINELFDEDMSYQLLYGTFGKLWEKKESGEIIPLPTPEGMSRDEFRYKTCPAWASPAAIYKETFEKVELTEDNLRKNERYEKIYSPFMPEEILPPLYYSVEQAEELSILKVDIDTYVKRMFAKWVSGEGDVEEDWDNYIQDLKKMKVDQLIKIYQEAYDFYKSVE